MQLRRVVAAGMIAVLVSGCGAALGSQGAADKARRELIPQQDPGDGGSVGAGGTPDSAPTPVTSPTGAPIIIPNSAGVTSTTLPPTSVTLLPTTSTTTTTIVPWKQNTYPDTLDGRIASLEAEDNYWELYRHWVTPPPAGSVSQFCRDLGAFMDTGNRFQTMRLARPDRASLRAAIGAVADALRTLRQYVPDQLPTVFMDASVSLDALGPQLDAARVDDLGPLVDSAVAQAAMPIQRVFESHQTDCPNLHHY